MYSFSGCITKAFHANFSSEISYIKVKSTSSVYFTYFIFQTANRNIKRHLFCTFLCRMHRCSAVEYHNTWTTKIRRNKICYSIHKKQLEAILRNMSYIIDIRKYFIQNSTLNFDANCKIVTKCIKLKYFYSLFINLDLNIWEKMINCFKFHVLLAFRIFRIYRSKT